MPFTSAEAIAGKILPGVLAHWQGEEDFWSRRVLCLAACPTRVPSLGRSAVSHLCWALGAGTAALGTRLGTVSAHTTTGPNSQAVLCHTSHRAEPCVPFSLQFHAGESRVHLYCNQQLWHGRATDHMEKSLSWGRKCPALCCRFLHPFIPVACHPAVSFPGLAASCERSQSVLAESFIHQCFSGAALVT